MISESVKYAALLHIIVTHIEENIIKKLPKLYSPLKKPEAGSKSPVLLLKKPLRMGDLLTSRKISIERPEINSLKMSSFLSKSILKKAFSYS